MFLLIYIKAACLVVREFGLAISYDADGNTAGISRSGNGNPVASSSYIYDAEDELTQLTQSSSAGTLAAYTWGYDADGRTVSQSAPEGTVDYGYDNDGQLISATSSNDSALAGSYAYDANGNRTSSSSASSYSTGADNELTNDGTYSWTYDNDGNPLVRTTLATGATLTYTWDNRNRLTDLTYYTASGTETEHIHYVYDPFDRRIAEQIATSSRALSLGRYDSSIYFSYGADPSTDEMLLISDSNGNITDRLLNGSGNHQVMADETATGTTWLLADGQGTVRDVVSNSGNELDHLSYDAYGNVLSQSNSGYAPLFQYTGMQADSSGLLYDYHRYYNPQDGRFISQDPSGFAAGDADLYRYVGNGPANGVDPRGLDQWSDDAAFAATVLRLGNRAPAEYRNNPFYVPPDVNPYAVVQQYGACAICHGSANGDWINLASGLDNRPVPLGQMAALQVTAHGNEDLNAAAGMIDGAAAVTALVVASIACPPLGVVLAGVGIGVGISDATNRVQQDHEPMEQALFGAATDVTGINGIYAGITNDDLATEKYLGLNDYQRGFGLGAGMIGAPATAIGIVGLGNDYLGASAALSGNPDNAGSLPLFRKMSADEAYSTLVTQQLQPSIPGTNSSKYLSESLAKVLAFQNQAADATDQQIVQFNVDQRGYDDLMSDAVDEFGSGGVDAVKINYQGILPGTGLRNIGVPSSQLGGFNNIVNDAFAIDGSYSSGSAYTEPESSSFSPLTNEDLRNLGAIGTSFNNSPSGSAPDDYNSQAQSGSEAPGLQIGGDDGF